MMAQWPVAMIARGTQCWDMAKPVDRPTTFIQKIAHEICGRITAEYDAPSPRLTLHALL